jgi:hypothetical protein
VRGTANPDHAFWSKPVDADAGWIGDLTPDDAAPTDALDDLASDPATSDRVFHELRDISARPVTEGLDTGDGQGEPPDAPPPAASVPFDINAVSDDLLPSWNLDLG